MARRLGLAGVAVLFLAPGPVQAQKIVDTVCEFYSVTVNSQPVQQGDIVPGDWMILSAEAPVDRPPTNGQPIPGGAAVYWDLDRQNQCSLVPPNAAVTSGEADLSRAIVEDALFDAVGWDSIGSFFTVGGSEITRCGMGLRDDDGATLDVVNFPDPLTLDGWTTNVCYFEGTVDSQVITALGVGELLVERDGESSDVTIDVPYGDEQALIAAVIWANTYEGDVLVGDIALRFTGTREAFVFDEPFAGSVNALPVVTAQITLVNTAVFRRGPEATDMFRFAHIAGNGAFQATAPVEISDFASGADGGALLVTDDGQFAGGGSFHGNSAMGDGGFASAQDNGQIQLFGGYVRANQSGSNGGAIAGTTTASLDLSSSTFIDGGGDEVVISSAGAGKALGNLIDQEGGAQAKQAGSTVQSSCGAAGGPLESLGYNISWDDTCNFDQPTDLVSTDPMLSAPDPNGISVPLAGSPAIDHGLSQVSDLLGDGVLRLPCGYRDVNGLGAPQDGNNDGVFECDSGAVEVQGAGAIEAGHSAAYFNALRNGEGQYVEILGGGERAIIYTFSYTPDGTGAAWFIAVADVVGNSLVSDELLRPLGTRWGDEFFAPEIDFSAAGGMSMVLPDCDGDPVGNVAYSGNSTLGFEPLITRAERLSDIFGCAGGGVTPHPNASRSGSYFDPSRNGEGLIIEWLPDGRVLVVMFTYAPSGEQMWMIGVGNADGDSVTVEVLYPTGFTEWGSGFDASAVVLEDWGTFTLTWVDEDNLTFDFASTVADYGSDSLNYQRLSNLEQP
ncbi:MAG: hypothetical protein R3212_01105 [Xanthomonadales bacterium]|nr:hypothetical protein [Xanthomonadales bacterium]